MEIRQGHSHKDMEAARSGWFECSCCPTNLTRLLPSVPGYMYAQKDNNIYVNLFIAGSADIQLGKKNINIVQQHNYPWDGALSFTVNTPSATPFNMMIRIPGWAQNVAIPSTLYRFENQSSYSPTIKINGQPFEYAIEKGYAVINRTWKKNDKVEVLLPMEVRSVAANENVKENIGKVALQRGPLIYCAEWADNDGRTSNFIIPSNTNFSSEFKPGLLNGVMILNAEVPAIVVNGNNVSTVKKNFTAIPYYSWANRGKGEMNVWFPKEVKDIEILSQ